MKQMLSAISSSATEGEKRRRANAQRQTKLLLRSTLPTCGGRRRKLVLVNRADETMKTSHDVIDASNYDSVSGVLKEHLEWPLCKSMANYENLAR